MSAFAVMSMSGWGRARDSRLSVALPGGRRQGGGFSRVYPTVPHALPRRPSGDPPATPRVACDRLGADGR